MITMLMTRGNDEGVYLKLPASSDEINKAFAELELLIVQDIFMTKTAMIADVILHTT